MGSEAVKAVPDTVKARSAVLTCLVKRTLHHPLHLAEGREYGRVAQALMA